jgi:DNA-binding transcriptional LysR family regulator
METTKCRALLTVLEAGSLAAAADELGYTTSGISRMMGSLEDELGFPLLVRSKAGVSPTAECERMLPLLTQLATLGDSCAQQAALICGVEVGSIRVGCAYQAFYAPLAEALAAFSKAHPGVRTEMTVENSTPLIQALERGELDLAVISMREGNVSWTPLLKDPMIALVPAGHPLAHAGAYPLARFAEDPFILLYPDEESDNSRTLAAFGVRPNVQSSVRELSDARELVGLGLGVTMVNSIFARWDDRRLRALPLDPVVEIPLGVATPKDELASPAARAFADFALPRLQRAAKAIAR